MALSKLKFFETLIMFLESTSNYLQEYFISKSNNNSYHDGTTAFFNVFFSEKRPDILTSLRWIYRYTDRRP